MLYDFQAIDNEGATLEGDVNATSEDQARLLLRKEFPNLRKIVWLRPQPQGKIKPLRLSHAEAVTFYRRLAVMLEAGVTIDRALSFLADATDGALAEVMEILQKDVSKGSHLLDAMSRPELCHIFSPLARGLIGTGLKTGALAESLGRLADVSERRFAQRKAFLSAMTYPAVLSFCIAALAILFLVFIAPGDSGIFASLGGDLPWPTQVLVNLSDWVRNPLPWAALLLTIALARPLLRPGARLRSVIDRKLLDLPVLGPLCEKAAAAEVLHIWSSSLRVGVPLSEGIALSLPAVTNAAILTRLQQANTCLKEGGDFGEALRQHRVFPQLVTSMISLGFESGQLDRMLERVSELYEEEVNSALDQLAKVLEPMLLAVAGCLAGFVALACLMPLLSLGNRL